MARPVSEKVISAKTRLINQLRDGTRRPGDRFLSVRSVSKIFDISIPTAQKILQELANDGLISIRSQSGTFISGEKPTLEGAQLLFMKKHGEGYQFADFFLKNFLSALDKAGVTWKLTWVTNDQPELLDDYYPVIMESKAAMEECILERRHALLLNDQPPGGLASIFLDVVRADDYSGGICAAEILFRRSNSKQKIAVIGGPKNDARSQGRIKGFLSVIPNAEVIYSGDWFSPNGYKAAPLALRKGNNGIFCCNDRLAEGVIQYCHERQIDSPPLIGYDNGPDAEEFHLTTIAIPWNKLIDTQVDVIKKRIAGDSSPAHHQVFPPYPVIRDQRFAY